MWNKKTFQLIDYDSGLGAQNQDCKFGPSKLHELKLLEKLNIVGINCKWQKSKSSYNFVYNNKHFILQQLATNNEILADKVIATLKLDRFPICIGGDHSMAIGTWSGVTKYLKNIQKFGLIWIDAHMDAHTPQTSPSGAYHGMPLACLLGYGETVLCNLVTKDAKLDPKHICLIGVRNYENEEDEFLRKLGVKIFYMHDIKQSGLKNVFKSAINYVTQNTSAFGISLDIDAIDPIDAPGTGTIAKDGIRAKDLLDILSNFEHHPKLKALEIAEFNPVLDQSDKTGKLIIEILQTFLPNI